MILQSIKSGKLLNMHANPGCSGDAESAYLAHPWLHITGEDIELWGECDLLKIRWVYCWG